MTLPQGWRTNERRSHVRLKHTSNSPQRESSNETTQRAGAGVLLGNYRANDTVMSLKEFPDQATSAGKL